MELPDTKTMHIKWPDGYEIEFKTGQFITTFWPDTPITNALTRSRPARWTGLLRSDGEARRQNGHARRRLGEGRRQDRHSAARGKFLPVYEPNKHLICIAGGSGITPFRGFAREATRRKLETKVTILYSVRTTTDIIFNDEFRQLEKENPNFKFEVTCTRLGDEDPWTGRRGRITPNGSRAFWRTIECRILCVWTERLVDAAEQLVLKELALPKEQLRLEKWG
jgi:ferredoxin-NADP reductase